MFSGLTFEVYDALLMGVLQGLTDCGHNRQRLLRRELPRLQQLPQAQPIGKLHEQVIQAIGLAEVIDGDNVRVIQPVELPSLAGASELLPQASHGAVEQGQRPAPLEDPVRRSAFNRFDPIALLGQFGV